MRCFLFCVFSAVLSFQFIFSGLAENSTERFMFKEPRNVFYRMVSSSERPAEDVITAIELDGPFASVEFGRKFFLRATEPLDFQATKTSFGVALALQIDARTAVFEATNALSAFRLAASFASLDSTEVAYPLRWRSVEMQGRYAAQPDDIYYLTQWYLENRGESGAVMGPHLNVREAWSRTRGTNVVVAVVDQGVELDHPELAPRAASNLHFNFDTGTTNARPALATPSWAHGTAVAGLIAAEANNGRGMSGTAPAAQFASWVIFKTNLALVSEDTLFQMYQYHSNEVAVQNHSWGNNGLRQQQPGFLERLAISNATTFGRGGLGVVMVRSAGNDRTRGANSDDDGYPSDPRVIAAGAVRVDGRVASYSEAGACVLVAAPSGDNGFPLLFTTDLVGPRGFNQIFFPNDLADYRFNSLGFSGTSASAALISGVAALALGANPNLGYRDVQQILALSSRHFDWADPDLFTNAAALVVSHNDGFGIPDAGVVADLALMWSNRPPASVVTITNEGIVAIPDDGLRVELTGLLVPEPLRSIRTLPSVGPHADRPTVYLPMKFVGVASNALDMDLHGFGALIQRGSVPYADQVNNAARAGAAFAIVYNNTQGSANCPGGDALCNLVGTDFVPIPAVFIGQSDGEALKGLADNSPVLRVRIHLNSAEIPFSVTNTLVCEHVGVRLKTDQPLRGDLRITLVSPQGTRSVLQRFNGDIDPGPADWTYFSVHHLLESSAGEWKLFVSDEYMGNNGSVLEASLVLEGVPIDDSDADGLDDAWERRYFSDLRFMAADDPDGDGYSNAREQIMGTNPLGEDIAFQIDASVWNPTRVRLSWPGKPGMRYRIYSGTFPQSFSVAAEVPSTWPRTEWFAPVTDTPRFFRVEAAPVQ
jgi:hypothetical protein